MGNKKKQLATKGSGFPANAPLAATAPRWPPFKPHLPVVQPSFDRPSPKFEDQIVVIRNFFPKSLCRDYVAFLAGLPLSTTPGKPKRGEASRYNDRFQIDDPQFARRLWLETGLKEAVIQQSVKGLWGGEVIGLNPNIRIYRYTPGQFFDCHYDDYNLVSVPSENGQETINAKTTWTVLLYLTSATEGCQGGETVFYANDRKLAAEEIVIGPETGMVLLHKHGNDCLLHEGREVVAGQKWIIRTDLCVRR
ncbi:hypothetical protein F5Y18DRAFT_197443 [Xylariaceae sp. FL1019]|nr:hypothetical protein F5Y18DRAFT_197443 [Xylariaceae sp. FL1019]